MIIPVVFGALILGRAFDMKNGVSTPVYIFDQEDLVSNTKIIHRTYTQSQYKFLESSAEANDFLNVAGDISLKVKNDQFKIQGSGTYLTKTVNRDKTVEMLITVNHETQTETFSSYTKLRDDWQSKPQSDVGTHYIRSITYGGQLIISYQLIAKEMEFMEDIKAAVSANLALSGSFSGDAKGDFEKLAKAVDKKATVVISASATAGAIDPPQNLEDVFKLVDDYPGLVNELNGGKGAPLKLEIVELSTLQPDYEAYLKNYAMDGMLNEATNKYDDVRVSMKMYRDWENQGQLWPPEKEKLIDAYQKQLKLANRALSDAISILDPTGGLNQFDAAFKIYGEDGDNIPNRYTRDLQRLIHIVEEKPFYWFPYTKAISHYIHWGSMNCSLPSPEPVFIGYAGTSPKGFGSGGNMMCLKNIDPIIEEEKVSSGTSLSYINGIGYSTPSETTGQVFCAFCRLENATAAFTITGRTDCPGEMKLEYSGYLMTSPDAGSASRFICLDSTPDESIPPIPTSPDKQSGTLHPVWMKCEDCDEDEQVKYVGCAVCSR